MVHVQRSERVSEYETFGRGQGLKHICRQHDVTAKLRVVISTLKCCAGLLLCYQCPGVGL